MELPPICDSTAGILESVGIREVRGERFAGRALTDPPTRFKERTFEHFQKRRNAYANLRGAEPITPEVTRVRWHQENYLAFP